MPSPSTTALILGGRSWVGFRLVEALSELSVTSICTTTGAPDEIEHEIHRVSYERADSPTEVRDLIEATAPDFVVNLRIGVQEQDLEAHVAAASAARRCGAHFTLASSALALDGYCGLELTESVPPRSISEYGSFKARCEEHLTTVSDLRSLTVRFASIHGVSPWKASRTQMFLRRVAAGEQVEVDLGVVQNRVTDHHLAETIANLITNDRTGTAHIGAADSSEEFAFLRRLAASFGYDPDLVVERETRNVNLAVIPDLGMHPDGPVTETDTLNALVRRGDLEGDMNKNATRS